MKNASAATLAILASGQYVKWDLYKFAFVSGGTLYLADADIPLTVGGQLYSGGLIFKRGAFRQANDLTVQTLSLDVSPQFDIPGGPPTVGGLPFLAAVRQGLFDGAIVSWSKLFLAIPTPSNYWNWPDTIPGAVPWFQGIVSDAQAGRSKATLSVHSGLELLNVQMPRNLLQAGCVHMLFDAGCTLSKAAFTSTGSLSASPGILAFNTGLTQADGYFDLGVITFTSGANNGITRTVRSYLHASGAIKLLMPLPSVPTAGDTFSIVPGCDKQQATCTTKFSNLPHYRGAPFVPVPETLYDGGATSPPAQLLGAQAGSLSGSFPSGNYPATYKP